MTRDAEPSLLDELCRFGDVREAGCVLEARGDSYVMMNSRNIFDRHTLLRASANPAISSLANAKI